MAHHLWFLRTIHLRRLPSHSGLLLPQLCHGRNRHDRLPRLQSSQRSPRNFHHRPVHLYLSHEILPSTVHPWQMGILRYSPLWSHYWSSRSCCCRVSDCHFLFRELHVSYHFHFGDTGSREEYKEGEFVVDYGGWGWSCFSAYSGCHC